MKILRTLLLIVSSPLPLPGFCCCYAVCSCLHHSYYSRPFDNFLFDKIAGSSCRLCFDLCNYFCNDLAGARELDFADCKWEVVLPRAHKLPMTPR